MCRDSIITHQPPTSEADDGVSLRHRTRRRGRQRPATSTSNICVVISVVVVAAVTLMSGSQDGCGIVVSGFSSPRHHPSSSATASSARGVGRPICNRPRPAPVASLLDPRVNPGIFSRRKKMCFARTLLGATVEESATANAESTVVVNGDGGSSSMAVNGDGSASLSVNGDSSANANGAAAISGRYENDPTIPDAPLPTVNGGYSHTKASRAKIAAANKGKTPWNKGKARSEEVKARIAAGVRKKNRERLLKKIADMGLTEEEYNAQKKEEKRKREAERRARKTEKGGYRPTQETKDKISAILKEKWAKGEVKKRAPSTGQRRKGFKHSEETKQKIRESLRKRWADDPEYRAKKKESARKQNTTSSSREKIANTLKKKWEDPKFRAYMMEKIKQRKKPAKVSDEHRAKISAAMKKKWQDEKYREKAVGNIRKAAAARPSRPTTRRKPASVQATKPKQRELKNGIIAMVPETAPRKKAVKKKAVRKATTKTKAKTKTKTTATTARTTRKKKVAPKKKKVDKPAEEGPGDFGPIEAVQPLTQPKRVFEDLDDDDDDDLDDFGGNGDLAQLRHERRDLFDLLYGDEDDIGANDAAIYDKQASAAPVAPRKVQKTTARGRPAVVSPIQRARVPANAEESDTLAAVAAAAGGGMPRADRKDPVFSPSLPSFSFDDDDDEDDSLDNFDPYGLEDF